MWTSSLTLKDTHLPLTPTVGIKGLAHDTGLQVSQSL